MCQGLLPESQDQDLALTVSYVTCSLGSGNRDFRKADLRLAERGEATTYPMNSNSRGFQQSSPPGRFVTLAGHHFYLAQCIYRLHIEGQLPTAPQNRQLDLLIENSRRQVDDSVGELTF